MIDQRAFLVAVAARLALVVVVAVAVLALVAVLVGCGDDCEAPPIDAAADAAECCLAGCPAPAPQCCENEDPRPVCEAP